MKYFLDTEFIEYPNTIELISIGIKCEDGRTYYAVCSDYNYDHADQWVKDNVIQPIFKDMVKDDWMGPENFHKYKGKSTEVIKNELLEFIGQPLVEGTEIPEFWAYFCNYDWVVFCWIFGRMIDLPRGWPMFCNDLKPLLNNSGKEQIDDPVGEHNALVDAEWNEKLYNHIMDE